MILSMGDLSFNEYASHILNTLKERSSAEIEMKGTYSVAIVEAYIKKLAEMPLDEFALLLEKALEIPELPEGVEPDPNDKEPMDAILQTNFTVEEIPDIYEMICAAKDFRSSVIQFPGTYIQESDDEDAYFEADQKK
jgi:hypothetical protein